MRRDHAEAGDHEAGALALLRAGSGKRLIVVQAIILVVLFATAQAYDGSIHALSHWFVLGAYALCSVGLGLAERWQRDAEDRRGAGIVRSRTEWLVWASTLLNAAVAVYIELEHMLAGTVAGFDGAASAVSRLPAFLLLLQTGLAMRVWHTALFSGAVILGWGLAIVLAIQRSSAMPLGPHVDLTDEVPALLTFVAASAIVIDGTRRLHAAVTTALRLEHERMLLARFVPGSVAVELAREGGLGRVMQRHACLLALDIRGFSALTRERSQDEMVRALLDVRALSHAAVSAHGGIVDKYVGDGMLAQFLVGRPEAQAQAALAACRMVLARLDELNRTRAQTDLPALRLTLALHSGEVLAGVFDDGQRAEFTVLGPAMNLLARLETRAKDADLALAASEDFVGLLRGSATPTRVEDGQSPALFGLATHGADTPARRLEGARVS